MGTVELQQDNAWSIVRAPTLLQVTGPLQIIAQVPLASHVDIVARWANAAPLAGLLARVITENLATLLDCYLQADAPPTPAELRAWRDTLPYQPGYLDRVASIAKPLHSRRMPASAHGSG